MCAAAGAFLNLSSRVMVDLSLPATCALATPEQLGLVALCGPALNAFGLRSYLCIVAVPPEPAPVCCCVCAAWRRGH